MVCYTSTDGNKGRCLDTIMNEEHLPSVAAPAAASWWFLGFLTLKNPPCRSTQKTFQHCFLPSCFQEQRWKALRATVIQQCSCCDTKHMKKGWVFQRLKKSTCCQPERAFSKAFDLALDVPLNRIMPMLLPFFGEGGRTWPVSTPVLVLLFLLVQPAQQNPLSQLTLSSWSFACFLTLNAWEVDSRHR